MKKVITLAILMAILLVGNASVRADPISWALVPSFLTVVMGQPVDADVVIFGKPIGVPPSIGAIDFDVTFDPVFLSPTGVTFGPFLGEPGVTALTDFSLSPGVVDFAAVSLLPSEGLDALQPATFTLATLSFNGLSSGTSTLAFSQAIVDDAFGNKIPEIPEPSSLVLLGTGLIAVAEAVRRSRKFQKSEKRA